MTRKVRTHAAGSGESPASDVKPKHLTKQEFGRRLYMMMTKKGWHQSELSRQSGLPRALVSTYVRGVSLPTPTSARKLAEALSVPVETLLPNIIEGAIDEDSPAFEMKVSPNDPGRAWLRVNRLVEVPTAVKIADLLQADDSNVLVDRKGSR